MISEQHEDIAESVHISKTWLDTTPVLDLAVLEQANISAVTAQATAQTDTEVILNKIDVRRMIDYESVQEVDLFYSYKCSVLDHSDYTLNTMFVQSICEVLYRFRQSAYLFFLWGYP